MVLYLVYHDILWYPILFISGYITRTRNEYYRLLQGVTERQEWAPYIKYMLRAFSRQARQTSIQLFEIVLMFKNTKNKIKENCGEIYSSDLVEHIFATPIITPVKLAKLMGIHYTTASRYLKKLDQMKFLVNKKVGKYQLYVNKELIKILNDGAAQDEK